GFIATSLTARCGWGESKEANEVAQTPHPAGHYFRTDAPSAQASLDERRRADKEEMRLFTERFNKLVDAIRTFADEYNKGQGNIWPMRQAEALRKAYRELDHSMTGRTEPAQRMHDHISN